MPDRISTINGVNTKLQELSKKRNNAYGRIKRLIQKNEFLEAYDRGRNMPSDDEVKSLTPAQRKSFDKFKDEIDNLAEISKEIREIHEKNNKNKADADNTVEVSKGQAPVTHKTDSSVVDVAKEAEETLVKTTEETTKPIILDTDKSETSQSTKDVKDKAQDKKTPATVTSSKPKETENENIDQLIQDKFLGMLNDRVADVEATDKETDDKKTSNKDSKHSADNVPSKTKDSDAKTAEVSDDTAVNKEQDNKPTAAKKTTTTSKASIDAPTKKRRKTRITKKDDADTQKEATAKVPVVDKKEDAKASVQDVIGESSKSQPQDDKIVTGTTNTDTAVAVEEEHRQDTYGATAKKRHAQKKTDVVAEKEEVAVDATPTIAQKKNSLQNVTTDTTPATDDNQPSAITDETAKKTDTGQEQPSVDKPVRKRATKRQSSKEEDINNGNSTPKQSSKKTEDKDKESQKDKDTSNTDVKVDDRKSENTTTNEVVEPQESNKLIAEPIDNVVNETAVVPDTIDDKDTQTPLSAPDETIDIIGTIKEEHEQTEKSVAEKKATEEATPENIGFHSPWNTGKKSKPFHRIVVNGDKTTDATIKEYKSDDARQTRQTDEYVIGQPINVSGNAPKQVTFNDNGTAQPDEIDNDDDVRLKDEQAVYLYHNVVKVADADEVGTTDDIPKKTVRFKTFKNAIKSLKERLFGGEKEDIED